MREVSAGSIVAGHRIESLVARGGMGVVYRVTHLSLDRERALKLIAPELAADQEFRTRFRREWKLAASIEHPHAIPVYDAGEVDGLLYIAMRYVHGTDLRRMILRDGPLEPRLAAEIVTQVASALDAAHVLGLIHRDIKPANILIEDRNGDPHAYLTDFGLSKHAASTVQLTDAGHWVGTVDYVAPEQIEGKPLDARTDIYGLGCVLFEALTGTVPYARENDVAKIWAHINDPPPSVLEKAPQLPKALDEVVRRAMAKDPSDRYLSAGDFGRATLEAAHGRSYVGPEQSVATGEAAGEGAPTAPLARARGFGRRLRQRYRAPMSVGVVLALLSAVIVAGVVVRGNDGGGGDSVAVRETLVTYQRQVGKICAERNRINRATARRAATGGQYRNRLKRARSLQAIRDAVLEEVQHRIDNATNLRSRVAGLEPPEALASTQRETVHSWDRNIARFQSYRDKLNAVRAYPGLDRLVRGFNSGRRSAIEREGARTASGLQRLGGPHCTLETSPTFRPVPLPPDPSGQDGDGPGPPTSLPPSSSPPPAASPGPGAQPDSVPSRPAPSPPPDSRPPPAAGGEG